MDLLMPLEGSRLIPPGWEAHHRPVAENTMTAKCRITRAGSGTGTWNPSSNRYDPPAREVVYDTLPCRVQELARPQIEPAGQQMVNIHHYRICIPITAAAVLVDDWIEITDGDATLDASLAGRQFVITDVQRGSLMWERDLVAIDNLG